MTREILSELHKKYLADYGLEDIDTDGLMIRNYQKGEFLCEQGSPLEDLLIITAGRVKVCSMAANGKALLFSFDDPGKILGEVEFMTNNFAATTVCAVTDAQCVVIPHERYRDYLLSNIKFLNQISSAMAEIITETATNSASNILYPFEARLCAYISTNHENGLFSQKLTELAEYLGTSYRHLLRTLDSLCSRGIIEKTAQGYVIKDESKLRAIGNNFFLR
jgi:CRP/FNR family putative post-exponential-phase nitrogen-starvation transcriptional regulator